MDSVLPALVWGGLFFLMMRFGCGSHMFGRGSRPQKESGTDSMGGCCGTGKDKHNQVPANSQQLRWEAPEHDNDLVCGETVSTDRAKSTVHDGQVYYFCSRECREAFEVRPEQYVGFGASGNVQRLDYIGDKGGSQG